MVQFPKSLLTQKIGYVEFEYRVKFYTRSSLMAVSANVY